MIGIIDKGRRLLQVLAMNGVGPSRLGQSPVLEPSQNQGQTGSLCSIIDRQQIAETEGFFSLILLS
jgi:hypothetical protein